MIGKQAGILLTVISTREALLQVEGELTGASNLVADWEMGLCDMERGILEVYDNAVQRAREDVIDNYQRSKH
ncbi:MAG: hypothetical protein KZQ84_10730 [Candidatus Thiodiazotropha sp. (ex Lucinoma borealis)]|nr:hypothetical protein [Candidatus Thiodiazotropha sp. (ex Lucinoma borealis)]